MRTLAANSFHGPDHLPERKQQVHAFVDRRQQELTGECGIAKIAEFGSRVRGPTQARGPERQRPAVPGVAPVRLARNAAIAS
jgi:hypothetical protein